MENTWPFVNLGFEEAKAHYAKLIEGKRLLFLRIINLLVTNLDDADEVFQEAMLLGWKCREQLRTEDTFVPWMIRIIRSVAAKRREQDKKDRRIWSVLFEAIQDSLSMRTHSHNPEGQMISEEEKTVALGAYERLPDTERIIYGLYHAEDYSQAEIGQMLDMPESTVRNHLHRAQGRLEKRMHSMVLVVLLEQLQHDYSSTLVQQVLDKISATSIPAETTVATAAGAGIAGQALPGGFFATLALPFLWITSLLISGTVSTTAFVRSMPTLQAKRWLVKQLVIFYVGAVATFVVSILGVIYIRTHHLDRDALNQTCWLLGCMFFAFVTVYVFQLNRKYQSCMRREGNKKETQNQAMTYGRFHLIIRNGLRIALATIVLFWCFLACHLLVVERETIKVNVAVFSLLTAVLTFAIHYGIVRLFEYFIKISSDETTFDLTKHFDETNCRQIKTSILRETIFVLPVLCFFLGANITHVVVSQVRVYSSIIEMLLYSALWIWVIYQNHLFPETRWVRIFFMLALQFFIFYGLRYFVY